MPTLRGPLVPDGALVEILVGLDAPSVQAARAALRPMPAPSGARALLDTGAEVTCVDSALILTLGLPFAGTTLGNLPAHGGLTVSALHDASLTVLHPSGNARDHLVVRSLTVLDVSLAVLGYEALIGRDVLAQCRFLFDGPRNRFLLAY